MLASFTFYEPALPVLGFKILTLDIFCSCIDDMVILI